MVQLIGVGGLQNHGSFPLLWLFMTLVFLNLPFISYFPFSYIFSFIIFILLFLSFFFVFLTFISTFFSFFSIYFFSFFFFHFLCRFFFVSVFFFAVKRCRQCGHPALVHLLDLIVLAAPLVGSLPQISIPGSPSLIPRDSWRLPTPSHTTPSLYVHLEVPVRLWQQVGRPVVLTATNFSTRLLYAGYLAV